MNELSMFSAVSARALQAELADCNRLTEAQGLTLTEGDMRALSRRREEALRDTGRVEFTGGIFRKLAYAFCDSAYITPANYADTLSELVALFYAFKSDIEDEMTDDELIEAMRRIFDGRAQGDLTYLADITLSQALTLDEQAQLQERLMLLLASRVRYATQGDSSSVSQEYAQALLEGVVFALQTHLQAQGLPARALLEPPLQALYEEALSTLQGLLDQVRALYLRACETAPVFPNRTLHDTLQAIEGFLGKYDYRMFPQDSHCTLDYPLCLPIAADLQGVRRIHAYLQHLCLENAFLLRFPPDAQAHVYHALSPDPRDLLINLYECAADQALGCMLCGGDLQSLTLGANGHAVLVRRRSAIADAGRKRPCRAGAAAICNR